MALQEAPPLVEDEQATQQGEGVETGAEALGDGAVETGDEPENGGELEAVKPTPPMQIALPGDWTRISSDFGGAEPTSSEIRLLGGKMPIDGSFAKGTELDLLVRVKVTGVLGQDVVDAWGAVGGTVRRHSARMISVQRANR